MIRAAAEPLDLSSHAFKPTKLIAEQFVPNWLSRQVKWLKKECHGLKKICLIAWMTFAKQILIASKIGWGFLSLIEQEANRQEAQARFFRQAEQAQPPPNDPIEIKTTKRTFNHVQDFAIEDGIIWTRHREFPAEAWKPVYFDGFANDHTPQSLSCDGANLVVLDERNAVSYKKVLREFRNTEIQGKHRNLFSRAGVDLANDFYIAIDKSERDNWKDKWFSLPYIHQIANFFIGKRLRLPLQTKAWAISHRGRYNNYLEDQANHRHLAGAGTTTLYALEASGKEIYQYDPRAPQYVKMPIPLPETAESSFTAENISASSSTIMTIGYEVHKDHPTIRTLKIYTRLADMDSEGWNTSHHYAYFENLPNPNLWILPFPAWESHPIQLAEGDFITRNITILQTGDGNQARELRVEGEHQGKKGIYFKMIDAHRWEFEAIENGVIEREELPLEQVHVDGFLTTVHHYESRTIVLQNVKTNSLSAQLLNFGKCSSHSILVLHLNGQEYELDVYRKRSLKNFVGFEDNSYDLVIPQDLHQDKRLMQAFKGQKVIPLKISENRTDLILENQKKSLFKFTFNKKI